MSEAHRQPTPLDTTLIDMLRERDGERTTVVMADGTRRIVFNIACGYDMGDQFAHVTTNISPRVDGAATDFFFTHDVREVRDERGGVIDIDLRGIGRADAQNGQLIRIVEDEGAGTVTIGAMVVHGGLAETACDVCGATTIMDDDFDAKFCPQCDRWLESRCDDPACEYCPTRPEPPMNRRVRG